LGTPKTSDTVAAGNLHNNLKFSASNEKDGGLPGPPPLIDCRTLWRFDCGQTPSLALGLIKIPTFWPAINQEIHSFLVNL